LEQTHAVGCTSKFNRTEWLFERTCPSRFQEDLVSLGINESVSLEELTRSICRYRACLSRPAARNQWRNRYVSGKPIVGRTCRYVAGSA
jgi:hypothetical protein